MTRARRSAVHACVQEARKRLKDAGVILRTVVKYSSPYLRLGVKGRTVYIPRWQGVVRTDPEFREAFIESLMHEFGHVYLNTWWPSIVRDGVIFGTFQQPYAVTACRALVNVRKPRPGFISRYAQTHPMEDFAETFLYVVRHGLCPPRTMDKVLQRKLTYMVRLLKN